MVLSELGIWAVSTIAGGIVGNQAYDKLKDIRQQTRRTFAGTLGAPADHDIDKAVASAAYQAVMVVLKDYEAAAGHRLAQDFVQVLGVALRDRVTLFRDPWTEPEIPTAARPHLNRLISASGGTPEAVADISPFLTDVMLAEVTEMAGGIVVPEAFVASMRANEPNGFFPRFRAFIAQELAINDRFHRLFVATRLAEMADGVDVMRGKMERFAREAAELRDVLGEVQEDVRDVKRLLIQAIGDKKLAEQALDGLRHEKNLTERAILFFLSRVFNESVQPSDVIPFLYERADELATRKTEAISVLARDRSNSSSEVDALRRAAAEALLNEDFDRNAELLRQTADTEVDAFRLEEGRLSEQIKATERRRVRALNSLRALVDAEKMRGNPQKTAEAVWLLFEFECPLHIPQSDRFGIASAIQNEWYVKGREKGDSFSLHVALGLAEKQRALATNAEQRCASGNSLGNVLATLGERENSNRRLIEAVSVYRAALKQCNRERYPLNWAITHNNLGCALSRLGEREGYSARLEEAIKSFQAALQVSKRGYAPHFWTGTQNNLGNALKTLGERRADTRLLEESLLAYRSALDGTDRHTAKLDWAMMQNNIGSVLSTLGERENGTRRLYEAVAAYRAALEEFERERVPLEWAMTQNNIGALLSRLADRETSTDKLKEAILAFRLSLEERTRERVPLDWAITLNNLANALSKLGERELSNEQLEEAVALYRLSLQERTRERVPIEWAMTQNNLGNVLAKLGARDSGSEKLNEAIAAYRSALQERTRERVPLDWATTQNNLGNALRNLGERVMEADYLKQAVAAYKEALHEWTRERVPLHWGGVQTNLGNALTSLGELENCVARFEEAIVAYRLALEERNINLVPLDWAVTFGNEGVALLKIAEIERDSSLAERALSQVESAREILANAKHIAFAEYYSLNAQRARMLIKELK